MLYLTEGGTWQSVGLSAKVEIICRCEETRSGGLTKQFGIVHLSLFTTERSALIATNFDL
jgi:hypothetical protein